MSITNLTRPLIDRKTNVTHKNTKSCEPIYSLQYQIFLFATRNTQQKYSASTCHLQYFLNHTPILRKLSKSDWGLQRKKNKM